MNEPVPAPSPLRLFLAGDVMCGRGIDQILPHPSAPILYEPCVQDARDYVGLAEAVNGTIPRDAAFAYPWGDALDELARRAPALRIVNLETSVTRSDQPWPKGINYRMHPDNLPFLTAAGLDCCVLANNHVLDWHYAGLIETLQRLQDAGFATAGAGLDAAHAQAPAVLLLPEGGRLRVFAAATGDCGVPPDWAATLTMSGVHRLPDLSPASAAALARHIVDRRRPGDRVILSLHWGGNWGFEVPAAQRRFAHTLIDEAGVDIIYGHSSHHVKAIEVYRERLILYGCGDLLNDYEGIRGEEGFHADLGLLYFPTLDAASGRLQALELVPTQLWRFSVRRAGVAGRRWLQETLARECRRFGVGLTASAGDPFSLQW